MMNTAETNLPKKLVRSRTNRMFLGVCGGIAEYFSIDSTVVRALYILLSVLTAAFPGILIYFLLALVMPTADE
jgi:phage shock protein C